MRFLIGRHGAITFKSLNSKLALPKNNVTSENSALVTGVETYEKCLAAPSAKLITKLKHTFNLEARLAHQLAELLTLKPFFRIAASWHVRCGIKVNQPSLQAT